jgi:hypothetical protein
VLPLLRTFPGLNQKETPFEDDKKDGIKHILVLPGGYVYNNMGEIRIHL